MALQGVAEVQMIQARVQEAVTDWRAEWFMGGSAEELGDAMAMFGEIAKEFS